MSSKQIIFAIVGGFVTFVGFLFSDEIKYPVAAKFSGPMIIVGLILVGLSVPIKWNPISGTLLNKASA